VVAHVARGGGSVHEVGWLDRSVPAALVVLAAMSRVLAVDYGTRRIGLALSDPTRTLASPIPTLVRRAGKRPPWAELQRVVEENEVAEIVVGLPLHLSGEETAWCAEVRRFSEALSSRTGLPVHLLDERLTSVYGERLVRGSGLRKSEREDKSRVDAAAAAILLQVHLERSRLSDERL
jgi:putative holliday junction resolvase